MLLLKKKIDEYNITKKGLNSYGISLVSLEITFPKVSRLLLIYAPSFRRSTSVATFSDPAKSIKFCVTLLVHSIHMICDYTLPIERDEFHDSHQKECLSSYFQ